MGQVVTLPKLRSAFRDVMSATNLQQIGYTPHSLRRGGATLSFHAGVHVNAIKHHGTWRSSAVEGYLFSLPIARSPVALCFKKMLFK